MVRYAFFPTFTTLSDTLELTIGKFEAELLIKMLLPLVGTPPLQLLPVDHDELVLPVQ
jgi:hypothetical protein